MKRIYHLSLKQITLLASLIMSLVFVVSYVTIHYFWNHDEAVEIAQDLQKEEVSRVKTVINLQKSELAKALVDYAAWNDVADYIQQPNEEFISDSVNDHTFYSKQLKGIFLFDPNVSLVWGRLYDPIAKKELSYDEIRYQFGSLLVDALRSRTDQIMPFVKFLVLNDEPTLMATSRVCNSDGVDCDKGYMLMIKPVSNEFTRALKQATGLDVEVVTRESLRVQQLANQENITVLDKLDFQNNFNLAVVIKHSSKLPTFLSWGELGAIFAFAICMFVVNLYLVHLLIKPLKRARVALDDFSRGKNLIEEEDRFISYEMRDFAVRVNELFAKLDQQRSDLELRSLYDELTQVANRRKLQAHWNQLQESQSPSYVAIVLIDIDHFKPFNDNYGHLEGDLALRAVAQQLDRAKSNCNKLVARFGGEEFCIIFSSHRRFDSAREAETLVKSVMELNIHHQHSPTHSVLTISAGVADCGLESLKCQQDILRLADSALYKAKKKGRNQYVIEPYIQYGCCTDSVNETIRLHP